MASTEKVAAVVGVGPGLGAAIARRFAREGFALALMARGTEDLKPVREEIEASSGRAISVSVDATVPDEVTEAFSRVRDTLGEVSVLIYNAGVFPVAGILELTPERFLQSWQINCYGAFLAARQVLPKMISRGQGTILLTGATGSMRGSARFAGLAVGKFGLRALAQSLAREFSPQGIHVGHVIIDGQIGRDSTNRLSPEAIADSYWYLHQQDPTAWTLELDLRPAVEKF